MKKSLSCLLGLVLLLACPQAKAALIDQAYVGESSLSSALAEYYAFVGQTVTTGVTGDLVAVELYAGERSGFSIPWVLDIQQVAGGVPTGVVLSSTTFPDLYGGAPSVPLPVRVDLSVPVFFNAGDPFAIILYPQGATGSPGLLAGSWDGTLPGGYAGGDAVAGFQPNALTIVTVLGERADLHFRTWVAPIPEPSTFLMLGSGLIGLAGYGRKKFIRK